MLDSIKDEKFKQTLKSALELQNALKCKNCKTIASEPYLNDKCEHLLCKKCIFISNKCPYCGVKFDEIEAYDVIREAIYYVEQIINVIKETDNFAGEESSKQNNETDECSNDTVIDILIEDETSEDENAVTKGEDVDQTVLINADILQREIGLNNGDLRNIPTVQKAPESMLITVDTSENDAIATSVQEIKVPQTRQTRSRAKETDLNTTAYEDKPKRRGKNKKQEDDEVLFKPNPTTTKSTQSKRKKSGIGNETILIASQVDVDLNASQSTQAKAKSAKRSKINDKGETELHLAAVEGNYELVKELLKTAKDINVKDYAGWTPLHEACEYGHPEIVRLLLDNNASINDKGFKDNTPIHEAIMNDHLECVKVLLQHDADLTIRNTYGFLPKELAKKNSKTLKIIQDFEKTRVKKVINEPVTQTEESFRRPPGVKKSKRICVFGTGMNDEEKAKLNRFSEKLDIKVAKEMGNTVTHIIFKSTNKFCQRTINYMKSVLMGLWIVSEEWLVNSFEAGHLLDENEYEASGSHKFPDCNAPYKGRVNACYEHPALFENCHFYFHGEFKVFDKNDLMQLVKLGGGTIIRREPKLDRLDELMKDVPYHVDKSANFKCSHFILYDTSKPRDIVRHMHLNTVHINWLFNTIDHFKIFVDENTR